MQQIIELKGRVSQGDLDKLTQDIDSVRDLGRKKQFDEGQKKTIGATLNNAAQALQNVKQTNPELGPKADEALERVAAAAADVGVQPIITPAPAATATPTAPASPSATASPRVTASPSPAPQTPAASASPAGTPTPDASATPSVTSTVGAGTLVTPAASLAASPSPSPAP